MNNSLHPTKDRIKEVSDKKEDNVFTMLSKTLETYGDQVALKEKDSSGNWIELTWNQYISKSESFAGSLKKLDVGFDDCVALFMKNCPQFHIADVGAQIVGGIGVSLYNSVSNEQLEYLLNHCQAKVVVIGSNEQQEKLKQIISSVLNIQHVILLEGLDESILEGCNVKIHKFEELSDVDNENKMSLDEARIRTKGDHLATIIYTSGTTGLPKGVMLTHSNITFTVQILRTIFQENNIDLSGFRLVSYLPMAHIAERVVSHYGAMAFGFELTTCPDPGLIVQYLGATRPNLLFAVPRIWEKAYATINSLIGKEDRQFFEEALEVGWEVSCLKAKGEELSPLLAQKWAEVDSMVCEPWRMMLGLDDCQVAVSGAAPLPENLFKFFRSLGLPLGEIYGLSETCGPLAYSPVKVKPGTVGQIVPGLVVKLSDDNEILVRGGNVFSGYYKNLEQTEENFEDLIIENGLVIDGWFKTGDIGSFDSEDNLSVIDRKKELIVTAGGKNVAPSYLEGIIKTHPIVSQACVVGDGKPYLSVLISLDKDESNVWASKNGISATSIVDLSKTTEIQNEISSVITELNTHVSSAEGIKKFYIVDEEWSVENGLITPTMKLKRKQVLEHYQDKIDEFYN